jgi:hypothetical protein
MLLSIYQGIFIGFFKQFIKTSQEVRSLGISVLSSQVPFTNRKNYLGFTVLSKKHLFPVLYLSSLSLTLNKPIIAGITKALY